jgi:hypothetical protein
MAVNAMCFGELTKLRFKGARLLGAQQGIREQKGKRSEDGEAKGAHRSHPGWWSGACVVVPLVFWAPGHRIVPKSVLFFAK